MPSNSLEMLVQSAISYVSAADFPLILKLLGVPKFILRKLTEAHEWVLRSSDQEIITRNDVRDRQDRLRSNGDEIRDRNISGDHLYVTVNSLIEAFEHLKQIKDPFLLMTISNIVFDHNNHTIVIELALNEQSDCRNVSSLKKEENSK
jgi:hypothetical protein